MLSLLCKEVHLSGFLSKEDRTFDPDDCLTPADGLATAKKLSSSSAACALVAFRLRGFGCNAEFRRDLEVHRSIFATADGARTADEIPGKSDACGISHDYESEVDKERSSEVKAKPNVACMFLDLGFYQINGSTVLNKL